MTVRALARHAGVSPQAALGYVNELSAAGIVHAERAGSAVMVSLNHDHLVAEPLVALAHARGRLVERLRDEVAGQTELVAGWLFGSVARGEGSRDSDIDLLLVAHSTLDGSGWSSLTTRLRERVRAWTGNEAQLVEHTQSSLERLVGRRAPIIGAIRSEGVLLTKKGSELLRTAA